MNDTPKLTHLSMYGSRVSDPENWTPCSPEFLSNGGECTHERVWCEDTGNHWHRSNVNEWRDAILDELVSTGDGGAKTPAQLLNHVITTNIVHYADPRICRQAGELETARRNLEAWFKSGNDVPRDMGFLFRTQWRQIMEDAQKLIDASKAMLYYDPTTTDEVMP